jgi:hypothetical protein
MFVFYVFWILRVPIYAVKQTADIRQILPIKDVFVFLWIFIEGFLFILLMLIARNSHIFGVYVSDIYSVSVLRIVRVSH